MTLSRYVEQVSAASRYIQSRIRIIPQTAIVLGTGLDRLSDLIRVETEIEFSEIPNFPVSTVQSHQGSLVFGTLASTPVIALRGRVHLYEGYDARTVTLPIRALGECGIRNLILSNASGGMNANLSSGNILLITDHINMMGQNPLEGPNNEKWGPRFPDMSDPYSSSLRALALKVANEESIPLHEGVYVAVMGPNLETRAEYEMLRMMGADVVGMSTVPEVLVARHMGINVLAFSVVTDECFPDTLQPVSIEDILAAAETATPLLSGLLERIIPRL